MSQMEQSFQIDPAEHDALLAEPHKVLPKLAARVHVAAVEAAIGAVRSHFAPMVMAVLEQQKTATEAEQQFYGKWPKLNSTEGKREVERLMTNYLAVNKGVSKEQAINDVGLLAHASLRIPLDVPGAPPATATPSPVPPAPPPPAQPGAAGGTPQTRQPTVWDKVDQELFTDD